MPCSPGVWTSQDSSLWRWAATIEIQRKILLFSSSFVKKAQCQALTKDVLSLSVQNHMFDTEAKECQNCLNSQSQTDSKPDISHSGQNAHRSRQPLVVAGGLAGHAFHACPSLRFWGGVRQ